MATQDEAADKRTPEQIAKHWHQQLDLAKKDTKDFIDNGDKVIARFKSGREGTKSVRTKKLNILYSNTEVLRAALYGKSAKPDVRRRFGVEDKAAGQVAEIIEKGLVYCAEVYDSDKPIELAILDYLLPGRGVVRIEYNPTISEGLVVDQEVYEKYVYWKDFLHMPARTWADILENGWIAFRHRMTRGEMHANKFEDADEIPLNWMPDLASKKDVPDSLKKAEVYEIWDVSDRKRYWIVEGFNRPCRIDDDPYGLEQFFPLPEPPAFYTTTDTIVPEPEFYVYQDQADDLDEIVGRISRLTRALKRRGVYDQSVKELSRLANAGDNQFIPVENYAQLATKGGLAAAFQSEDISVIAQVLIQLYQQRDMLVQAIWEQVGIADIMRGSSNASETLGAQQLKAQFGSQRLKRRQRTVQKWVRDLLKLKSEIIAEHFQPEVLEQMTGEKLTPVPPPPPPQPTGNPQQDQAAAQQFAAAQQQVAQQNANSQQIIQILRTDKLRSYRIDIETDSTVFEDAAEEKKERSELITAVSAFIQAWGPIVQSSPPLAPVAFELLKFGLAAFKSTRGVEDAIEQAAGIFEQQAAQPKPPSPEEQKAKVDAEAKQAQIAADAQAKQKQIESDNQQAAAKQASEDARVQREQDREDYRAQKEHERKLDELRMNAKFKAIEVRQSIAVERAKASLAIRTAKAGVAAKNKELSIKEKASSKKDAA